MTPIQVAVELSPRNYANDRIGVGFLQRYADLAQPKIRLARALLLIRPSGSMSCPGDLGARRHWSERPASRHTFQFLRRRLDQGTFNIWLAC